MEIQIEPIRPRSTLLIQQCYAGSEYAKMHVLTYPDNLAYSQRHKMDYYIFHGNITPEFETGNGAWAKLLLILNALRAGYEYVIYLDVDTVIADPSADLREACPQQGGIGMTLHYPEGHTEGVLNTGVIYVKNCPQVVELVWYWMQWYPGPAGNWYEMSTINLLANISEIRKLVIPVDAKYNSTRKANNHVDDAVVEGFHGEGSISQRMELMKAFINRQRINNG